MFAERQNTKSEAAAFERNLPIPAREISAAAWIFPWVRVHALLAGFAVAGTAFAAPTSAASARDVAVGEKVFAVCAACHAPDLPTKTGPDLRGVVGRKSGSVPGFRYSRALKTAGVVWNDATLDAFLAEPQAAFPGSAMPFPGMPDAEQRLALIAYLKTLK